MLRWLWRIRITRRHTSRTRRRKVLTSHDRGCRGTFQRSVRDGISIERIGILGICWRDILLPTALIMNSFTTLSSCPSEIDENRPKPVPRAFNRLRIVWRCTLSVRERATCVILLDLDVNTSASSASSTSFRGRPLAQGTLLTARSLGSTTCMSDLEQSCSVRRNVSPGF